MERRPPSLATTCTRFPFSRIATELAKGRLIVAAVSGGRVSATFAGSMLMRVRARGGGADGNFAKARGGGSNAKHLLHEPRGRSAGPAVGEADVVAFLAIRLE